MRSDLIGTADTNLSFLCVRWVHTRTPQSFLDSGQGPKNIEVCRIAVGEEGNRSEGVVARPEMDKTFLDNWLFLLFD